MKLQKSTQVATGGLASALCLVLMFLTGMIPFSTYALPAAAGAVLIAVEEENGSQTALLVYAAVSLLSLFIVPDREAALTFIAFFGYYPVLKRRVDAIQSKPVRAALKFSAYNLAILLSYSIAIRLFGMAYLLDGMEEFGKYALLVLLAMANVMFVLYDRALNALYFGYIHIFRVKFLGKVGH